MIDTRKIRHIRGDMSDFFQADLLPNGAFDVIFSIGL